jgi:hypothetical protein
MSREAKRDNEMKGNERKGDWEKTHGLASQPATIHSRQTRFVVLF